MTIRIGRIGLGGIAALALAGLALLLLPALSTAKHGSDDAGDRSKGRENAGTIASYDAQSGVLTIALKSGGTATAVVNDETRIRCVGSKRRGRGEAGHKRRNRGARCGTAALVADAPVRKARIDSEDGADVFEKVLIGKAGKGCGDRAAGDDSGRGGDDDGTPDQGSGDA